MSTGQIVEAYYKKWLNREPKEAGKSHYIWEIDQEGLSLAGFEDILKNSPEFQKTAGKQVDTWYQEILGREPDESGRNHYINKIKEQGFDDLSNIEDIFYNSQEYQKKQQQEEEEAADDNKIIIHGTEYDLPVPGQGGDKFGHADYHWLLATAGKGPEGKDNNYKDIEALQNVREDILYWLQKGNGKDFLADDNKPGAKNENTLSEKGLYDMIVQSGVEHSSGGKQFSGFGNHSILDDPNAYGVADVLAARAGGHTEFEIYSHMTNNKNLWDKPGDEYDIYRSTYNTIRGDLIKIGNTQGNLFGDTETKDGIEYSWKNTLQNPLWHEIGLYMKKHDLKDFGGKSVGWIGKDKKAYEAILEWQQERANAFNFLSKNDSGDLVTTLTTDKQLQQLIGVQGGEGEVIPPGTTEPGKYWSSWGEAGPGALNKPMLMAAGTGLGWEFEDEDEIDSKLDKLEEKFLSEMYGGATETVSSHAGTQTYPISPKYKKADDSWGIDIVRNGMRPEDFDDDWFDNKTGVMKKDHFQKLASVSYTHLTLPTTPYV